MKLSQQILELCEGKLLGSAPTEADILKGIIRFYGGSGHFELKAINDKEFDVHNSKGKIEGVVVKKKGGRYRFEMLETNESLDDELAKAHPYLSGAKVKSGPHTKEEAVKEAKELRAKGTHASVWHLSGPKSGPRSKFVVTVGDGKY